MSTKEVQQYEKMVALQFQALQLYQKKSKEYNDALAKFGVVGGLMRIEERIQQSLSVTQQSVCLGEEKGLQETLLDLLNYTTLTLLLLESKQEE